MVRRLLFAVLVVAALGIVAAGPARKQLVVVTNTPSAGQTLSGSATWQVSVSGGTPTRVDFAIDGSVKWSQKSSPYMYGGVSGGLDTTKLANGTHALSSTAYGSGNTREGTSQVAVTVSNPSPVPSSASYWGAWIGNHLTGTEAPWDMSAAASFEQMAGKPVSLLQFASPFANCSTTPCSYYNFPSTPFNNIRAHGAIPFFSWSSQSIPWSLNEPDFQLADVTDGTYDSYIRTFATRAKEWGHPFFLRFNWEMNGNWFPWSERANGNGTGHYVAAWRHVHDIFASVGATNATWVWCPYVDPNATLQALGSLYPGDAYVDWTCLDGYNWGPNATPPRTWRSFNYLFSPTYHQIVDTIAPSKPMLVGETASTEYGGSKAGWIHNMFEWLPTEFPKIRGLLWFEKRDNGMDWPIETSESARAAFAAGIAASRYRGNFYGGISTNPVPTP